MRSDEDNPIGAPPQGTGTNSAVSDFVFVDDLKARAASRISARCLGRHLAVARGSGV